MVSHMGPTQQIGDIAGWIRKCLTTTANLAATYRNQGRWSEAEALELVVMKKRKRVLGADTLTATSPAWKGEEKRAENATTMSIYNISLKVWGSHALHLTQQSTTDSSRRRNNTSGRQPMSDVSNQFQRQGNRGRSTQASTRYPVSDPERSQSPVDRRAGDKRRAPSVNSSDQENEENHPARRALPF
ncbi:hypothetical protein B0H11DRAFT_1931155 [Mycena galericulata]|nr:hypothetical protein B0H11DRAFT_1931155 [Mycena galericulata]